MQAKYAEAQKAYYNGQYLEMESEVILGYSKPKGTYLLYFVIFFCWVVFPVVLIIFS